MSRLKVALIFGGKSTEHSISVRSTKGIMSGINRDNYLLWLIRIDQEGNWWLLKGLDPEETKEATPMTLIPGETGARMTSTASGKLLGNLDLVFPVLHGTFGEDGTIQGLFKMVNVAFVGCGVASSAACMDKDITKRLLRDADIGIAPYLCATQTHKVSYHQAVKELGSETLFLKPACLGSSVGVHKVKNEAEYNAGLADGFKYDFKVIIEPNIIGREIECAVLGNENPKSSYPGEIVMEGDSFYDFESKYISKKAAQLQIPAQMPCEQMAQMRDMACRAFLACGCEGLARVDFFLKENGEIIVNEINTLPGFTEISMYPKMWEATGMDYAKLLDSLIELGRKRYEREKAIAHLPSHFFL